MRVQQAADAAAAPKKRRERKPFSIDFVNGEAVSTRKVFSTKGTPATMNLSEADRAARTVLPDDLRITPADLTRLFLKPKWQARLQPAATAGAPGTLVDGTAAADGSDGLAGSGGGYDGDHGGFDGGHDDGTAGTEVPAGRARDLNADSAFCAPVPPRVPPRIGSARCDEHDGQRDLLFGRRRRRLWRRRLWRPRPVVRRVRRRHRSGHVGHGGAAQGHPQSAHQLCPHRQEGRRQEAQGQPVAAAHARQRHRTTASSRKWRAAAATSGADGSGRCAVAELAWRRAVSRKTRPPR